MKLKRIKAKLCGPDLILAMPISFCGQYGRVQRIARFSNNRMVVVVGFQCRWESRKRSFVDLPEIIRVVFRYRIVTT